MRVENLFPPCNDIHCPLYRKHTHPIPHQLELIHSSEKYSYVQGGYGSAKTLAACILFLLLAAKIPGNRLVIARRSYPLLHDSTQRIFMEVLERSGLDWTGRENRDGWYHRIVLPNDSEVFFRESQNVGRWLGPEYGGFLIDEALEEPQSTFTKLQGRLRLAIAGPYLKGVLLSNPPHRTHWLRSRFGEEARTWTERTEVAPGRFENTSFRFMKVSTRSNPHNPPGYLADLIGGNTSAEVQRIVEGEYGFTPEGAPAYPTFQPERHIGLPVISDMNPSLVVSFDFGYRHPAAHWHQFFLCHKRQVHWHILSELDGAKIEGLPFIKEVLHKSKQLFPGQSSEMYEYCGDRSGAKVDDHGPGPILLAQTQLGISIDYKWCPVSPGVEMIRRFLALPVCECGQPRFLIHRTCRDTIEAFIGGYHLAQDKIGKSQKDEPIKDGFYDDYMDSVRYGAEHHLRAMLMDPDMQLKLDATDPRVMFGLPGESRRELDWTLRGPLTREGGLRDPWTRALNKMIEDARKGQEDRG